ncbi:hydrolase 2, exosortase A system-associated [Thioalkalivibrio sp. AKL17]|uniref:hydrolase 2, exosortase A system-associated n=1 Tax=Thioalkalivibrio sp. AKL17 TaxID=1158160 RepID=UPI0004772441|nr:hydrolase 2, exosortase A system-associated [Thioalkalivibrio sp. AKL17]
MRAGFRSGTAGPVFEVLHPPAGAPCRGTVLYVQPFAEEMNKSRRMAALQARQLAGQGFAVLMPDPYGCGDSGGDFSDARGDTWRQDLVQSVHWLEQAYPGPMALWGLRTGCLIVSELMQESGIVPAATVYWHPVTRGEGFLNQFLRLRMAAGMINGQRESTRDLRDRLAAGEALEVAGYTLAPGLAQWLGTATLNPPPCPLLWLEVSALSPPALTAGSARMVTGWQDAGADVISRAVPGEPFWNTQEIHEVPALLTETTEWISSRLNRRAVTA